MAIWLAYAGLLVVASPLLIGLTIEIAKDAAAPLYARVSVPLISVAAYIFFGTMWWGLRP